MYLQHIPLYAPHFASVRPVAGRQTHESLLRELAHSLRPAAVQQHSSLTLGLSVVRYTASVGVVARRDRRCHSFPPTPKEWANDEDRERELRLVEGQMEAATREKGVGETTLGSRHCPLEDGTMPRAVHVDSSSARLSSNDREATGFLDHSICRPRRLREPYPPSLDFAVLRAVAWPPTHSSIHITHLHDAFSLVEPDSAVNCLLVPD
uniref:Uncharacterized protein n=1 Tax=Mycena chlorophos TaxID=658473 RepID=A0ABQ0M0E3_MYCCL|nr:predicted protein [Mycena chlorophos]